MCNLHGWARAPSCRAAAPEARSGVLLEGKAKRRMPARQGNDRGLPVGLQAQRRIAHWLTAPCMRVGLLPASAAAGEPATLAAELRDPLLVALPFPRPPPCVLSPRQHECFFSVTSIHVTIKLTAPVVNAQHCRACYGDRAPTRCQRKVNCSRWRRLFTCTDSGG